MDTKRSEYYLLNRFTPSPSIPSTTSMPAATSTASAWRPWANLGNTTLNRAYMGHFMYSMSSAHPSCSSSTKSATALAAPAPASPMEVDNLNSLELEEITMGGGQDDHLLEVWTP